MINPKKAAEYYRLQNPAISSRLTDEEAYDLFKRKYTNFEYPEENPFKIKYPTSDKYEINKEASWGEENQGWLESFALGNPIEYFAENGNWAAKAYNESMAGLLYQSIYGKAKFEVTDFDDSIWEEIGQFAAGLLNPVDIGLFAFTSGLGSVAVKTAGLQGLKQVIGKGTIKSIEKIIQEKGRKE